MKDRVLIIMTLVIVMGLAVACGNGRKSSAGDNVVELKVIPERTDGVPESLKLVVANRSDSTVRFGADYAVERHVEGEWVKHDLGDFAVIMITYNLAPGESGEYDINLFPGRAEYPEGEYRIVKMISGGSVDGKPYYGYFMINGPS